MYKRHKCIQARKDKNYIVKILQLNCDKIYNLFDLRWKNKNESQLNDKAWGKFYFNKLVGAF